MTAQANSVPLPSKGGSFTRDENGSLKPVQTPVSNKGNKTAPKAKEA
ncbi:hypothetical protein [Phaeobacter inhibens]|nr:hypothetical protein [Phaeobacter inhibens]